MTDPTFLDIWDKLSIISVNDHIQKKNNLSYLSWTWAVQVMMENYPEHIYEFHETETHLDGSQTVHCTVTIGSHSRTMWLPVMTGFKNEAKPKPSARDVGDAKMRCLVKCYAMFGLGHYIYAGEDLPRGNERTRRSSQAAKSETPTPAEPEAKEDPLAPLDAKGALSEAQAEVDKASEEFFTVFLEECDDLEKLRAFWSDNKVALKEMETNNKVVFDRVLGAFQSRKAEISTAA